MHSMLHWLVQNLDYMVVSALFMSIISFFSSVVQIWRRKKSRAIAESAVLRKESGTLTVRIGSEMLQIGSPIAKTRQLSPEHVGLIYYSLGGVRLMPYAQSLHSSATAEGKIEQTDESETGTNTLATVERQFSPPGQSARNPNVALKKSIGIRHDLLCGSGV